MARALTAAGALAGGFLGAMTGDVLARALPAGSPYLQLGFFAAGLLVGTRALRALPVAPAGTPVTLLDTSALVDGRVPDLVRAGFLPGRLVVPPFVLRELRGLSDAGDATKRARGQRGLASLESLRALAQDALSFPSDELPEIPEVDVKLAELARRSGARLLTLDANLRKVAAARGVVPLGLHELARAFRLTAQPGEVVRLAVVKEGREPGQGVGHLEDGTMVVVDGASGRIGREVEVVLTNVVQTSAGRMFFARLRDPA